MKPGRSLRVQCLAPSYMHTLQGNGRSCTRDITGHGTLSSLILHVCARCHLTALPTPTMTTVPTRLALTPTHIEQRLPRLAAWRWDANKGCIEQSWTFDSFRNLMTCLAHIADLAEQLDHHPHITTCYTHLHIQLSTHDAQGLTDLDFQLAESIDRLIERGFTTT